MTREEMEQILCEIARDPDAADQSRVNAIKALDELHRRWNADSEPTGDFADLYQFAPRPRLRVKEGGNEAS
jgi:hypothetical protein